MRGCFLILEDASADEFADDGVAGDVRRVQGRQAPDHFHEDRQTVLGDERVVEIRGELRDLPQVLGEDTQLVVVEGIDVDGGVRLVGGDVFLLALVDGLGADDGLRIWYGQWNRSDQVW